ncbi:MAG: twin-arginine translocase TatA/TatE family subunit [Phycisphaeraceae bacterium]|nr:twin-arginine translocase TatA/TatE family subunit [Phycisphaeraceae bacterium]
MTPTLAFISGLGPWEIGAILLVALLFFGGRLPEVGRSLGRGIVEFKRGIRGINDEIDDASDQPDHRLKDPRKSRDNPDDRDSD